MLTPDAKLPNGLSARALAIHTIPRDALRLRIAPVLRAFFRLPAAPLFFFAYLFFEYVRPQSIYPQISFIPWARLSLIAAIASAFMLELRKRQSLPTDFSLAAYALVVFSSILTAYSPAYAWDKIDIFVSWILVYFAATTAVNTQTRAFFMVATWILWNFKMSLHGFRSWASVGFAFRDWGVAGAPGWFANSGEFGIEMAGFFPVSLFFALALRPHVSRLQFLFLMFVPFTAVAGAIASSSRGAVAGVAAVGLWLLVRSKLRFKVTVGVVVATAIAWSVVPEEQKLRFSSSGADYTSTSRLTYWKRGVEMANQHPILGIGYANWMPYYTDVWGPRLQAGEKIQPPHNLFIEALSELGYLGMIAFLAVITSMFVTNARTRRAARTLGGAGRFSEHIAWGLDGALIGFLVSGSFVSVLYYPYVWVNLAMTGSLFASVKRAQSALRSRQPNTSG